MISSHALSTYARHHRFRAILIAALVILIVDFSADDGCGCDDAVPRPSNAAPVITHLGGIDDGA
jgi:hypothetical protein